MAAGMQGAVPIRTTRPAGAASRLPARALQLGQTRRPLAGSTEEREVVWRDRRFDCRTTRQVARRAAERVAFALIAVSARSTAKPPVQSHLVSHDHPLTGEAYQRLGLDVTVAEREYIGGRGWPRGSRPARSRSPTRQRSSGPLARASGVAQAELDSGLADSFGMPHWRHSEAHPVLPGARLVTFARRAR
jgi:hypothetical protein